MLNLIDSVRYWLKDVFLHPLVDFLLDNFNWIQIEGQVFNLENGDILIQWNGKYSKHRSLVQKDNKSIHRQLKDLPDGTVFFCDRIWGVDGTLKKIRFVEVAIRGDEFDLFTENEYLLDPSFYKLRDSVEIYKKRMAEIMSEIGKSMQDIVN